MNYDEYISSLNKTYKGKDFSQADIIKLLTEILDKINGACSSNSGYIIDLFMKEYSQSVADQSTSMEINLPIREKIQEGHLKISLEIVRMDLFKTLFFERVGL